jgi:hypothetical protein
MAPPRAFTAQRRASSSLGKTTAFRGGMNLIFIQRYGLGRLFLGVLFLHIKNKLKFRIHFK